MTIDEAIEINQVTLDDEFTTLHLDQLEAVKLGIEALKSWRDFREANNAWLYPYLPGETK